MKNEPKDATPVAKECYKFHKDTTVYDFVADCLKAIREVAPECTTLMKRRGGVIRFDFCPGAGKGGKKFRRWLGLPEDENLSPEALQLVYRVMPDFDFKIWIEDDGERGYVDCAAYSELKAASCSMRLSQGIGYESGELNNIDVKCPEEWGYAVHQGCIVFVLVRADKPCKEVGQIYVAVSGGMQNEDDKLARQTAKVVARYFDDDSKVMVTSASKHLT